MQFSLTDLDKVPSENRPKAYIKGFLRGSLWRGGVDTRQRSGALWAMILAYIESFKYVGHLWPITFLRWVIGWQYFRMAMNHIHSQFLSHPYLSEQLRMKMEGVGFIHGYLRFWEVLVQENWLVVSYVIVASELLIGASYFLGYLVRPISLWAAFLSVHLYWLVEAQGDMSQLFACYIHLTFCLLGAGRCLGLDYYFYKSRRGLLW